MITHSKKWKNAGTRFLLATVVAVVYRILICIQLALSYDYRSLPWDTSQNMGCNIAVGIVTVVAYTLLALYCVKFRDTEKGPKLYFLTLGIYAAMEVGTGFLTFVINSLFLGHIDVLMKILEVFLCWAVLALMLVVKFKHNRWIAWIGTIAFGGYALLMLHNLGVNYRDVGHKYNFIENGSPPIVNYFTYAVSVCSAVLQLVALWGLWWLEGGNRILKKNAADEQPTPINRAQKIWRVCFAVCFILTILVWCVLTYKAFQSDPMDQDAKYLYAFGPAIWAVYSGVPLVALLAGEFVIYRMIKDSLGSYETN